MDSSPMPFEVHPSSGLPIYRQIIDQVHALIAGGNLCPGDLLPSVRQVAQAAAINPMTVSKAYSRLEADGVVERVRGQGMRVAANDAVGTLRERREKFRQIIEPAIFRAYQLGLSEQQVRKEIDQILTSLTVETPS